MMRQSCFETSVSWPGFTRSLASRGAHLWFNPEPLLYAYCQLALGR